MARIDVPALMMTGDEEEPCLEVKLLMKRTIPNAALAVLPRSGHAINLEEPALFNQLLEDFLHQVEAGRWEPRDPRSTRALDLRPGEASHELRVEKRGAAGWIVFDQPAKRNAINGAMWRGIPPAMRQFDADPEVRCVAFRGAGTEAFSAGADISEFERDRAEQVRGSRVRQPARSGAAFDPGLAQALGGDDLRLLHGRRPRGRARLRPALLRPRRRSSASRRRGSALPITSRGTSA